MIWLVARRFLVDVLIDIAYRVHRKRAQVATARAELPARARITTSAPPARPRQRRRETR